MTVPELAKFEENMVVFGQQYGKIYTDPTASFDQKLASCYYDSARIFSQIANYQSLHTLISTVDWSLFAKQAKDFWAEKYVKPNNGFVPGYWNFTEGLMIFGDKRSVDLLATNAAYARDSTPVHETDSTLLSREVAYAIESYLNAEALGSPRRARLDLLVTQSINYFDQWFVTESAPYVRPFMVALTCEALIDYHERYPIPDIVSYLRMAADWMWNRLWVPAAEAFRYGSVANETGNTEPAPDLNLLICPLYAYLYNKTGEERYLTQADLIFAGGVRKAWLGNVKQFNQNYRWSFRYLQWREDSREQDLRLAQFYLNRALER